MKSKLTKFIGIFLWGCVIIGLLYGARIGNFPWIGDLERYSIDKRFLIRGPREPSRDIIILGVDTPSVAALDRPPGTWNPIHAELINAMINASASCVFLDYIFDSRIDKVTREMISEHLAKYNIQVPPNVIQNLGFDTPLIAAFLNARKAGLKVVLALFSEKNLEDRIYWLFQVAWKAFINLSLDSDLSIRRCLVFSRYTGSGAIFPSVSLAMASEFMKQPFSLASDGALLLGNGRINNVTAENEGYIDFAGPRNTYPMEPYKNVILDARKNPEKLKRFAGKMVLVGPWDFTDNKTIPFGKMYGIELHANVIENILNNRFLNFIGEPFGALSSFLLLFIQSAAFYLGIVWGIFSTVFLASFWSAICIGFFKSSVIVPFAIPFAFLLIHGVFVSFWQFYWLDKESRKVRNLFGRYVNDSVIQTILKNPLESVLQGTRRRVCIMFVDIRGFTCFSESRDPKEVVAFLNRYFEELTRLILEKDGVVDKFLGDGLMAFFNAPIEKKGFVRDAVSCALMIRQLAKIFPIPSAPDSFTLKVGVALHVGEVLVGNIGSERKMEYTAIGDTVNTTSRIESLNKDFGTDIIATESVKSETGEEFEWKELGEKAIRGKENTVRLFSLTGKK